MSNNSILDGLLYGIGKLPGSYKHDKLPTKIDISNVAKAQVGFDRLLVILKDGSVMGCGASDYHALADVDDAPTLTPIPTKNYDNERILFVSNLYSASVAMSDSNLFMFGQTYVYLLY